VLFNLPPHAGERMQFFVGSRDPAPKHRSPQAYEFEA